MAYRADIGLLYYRTDLLRQYGYREPPRTWDELEIMAARNRGGQRAKGKKQLWGFFSQGGAARVWTLDRLGREAPHNGGRAITKDTSTEARHPQPSRAS